MGNDKQQELEHVHKVNRILIEQPERLFDQNRSTYSLFQSPLELEEQVRQRTVALTETLATLERSNQQLAIAKDAAEQANRSKTRFLAAASHDVLQPLNAALLLMSTLSAVQTDDEGGRLCRQVERSLETMDTLLRNLLYMSRLDAGEVKPHFQTVSLDQLFESIASDFEPIAKLRNLELRVRYSGLHVWSDPTMLRRIIQNIVANALRYTRTGGALLIANQHKHRVRVRIADTGIGIQKERYEDIFVEFQRCAQAHQGLDDSSAGMGLGLAIVERMIKTLDHPLSLNSRLGQGSCFSLSIPFMEAPSVSRAPNNTSLKATNSDFSTRESPIRVLIIENDLPALQAMEALLGQWGGYELRLASSTKEAMSALSRKQAWTPEIIVADQHLNDNERGTSAVRMLRQLIGRQIPAIIVTADPTERLWKMADQGQLEVMQKPLKPAQLRALLMHLCKRSCELSA